MRRVLALLSTTCLFACATVAPYDRERLSRPDMNADSDADGVADGAKGFDAPVSRLCIEPIQDRATDVAGIGCDRADFGDLKRVTVDGAQRG